MGDVESYATVTFEDVSYLPGMATDGLAFAMAEYYGARPTSFHMQPASVVGTQWQPALEALMEEEAKLAFEWAAESRLAH